MSFNQIKPQKGSEIVMQQLKQQIISGVYPPGSRLPSVVEFAAGFEVGRSTVREALSALKAMGWIDIRHGGGTFVCKELPNEEAAESFDLFDKTESFQEVLEVRRFIESGCAALAAKRRTQEDLDEIKATLEHMQDVLGNEQLGEQADVQFHLLIAQASHNTLLIQMMESLTHRLQESMKDSRRLWFYSERASAQRLLQEHQSIYEAIADKNEALASERTIEHISKVDAVLQRLL
ncbi:MAG: GntR family transcriptional regulator [Paenibacillus sp. RIFOXYA1_FULL_44_5]|nr:MAG: GntR family transcriptional regulator [Paenibacillus sp. RIFOXYA1_FULL_44_5]